MSHRGQRSIPGVSCSKKLRPVNSSLPLAGFPKEELHNISTQILTQHQNLESHEQKNCSIFVDFSLFSSCFIKVMLPTQLLGAPYLSCVNFLFSLPAWLKLASLLSLIFGSIHHGPCSRPSISPPPGSGHHAFELSRGTPALL